MAIYSENITVPCGDKAIRALGLTLRWEPANIGIMGGLVKASRPGKRGQKMSKRMRRAAMARGRAKDVMLTRVRREVMRHPRGGTDDQLDALTSSLGRLLFSYV